MCLPEATAPTISDRLTIPTSFSPRITGTRLILCVVMIVAISSTGVSSVTPTIVLLMMSFTCLPFLATISASETRPRIFPFLSLTGAPLIWFWIRIFARFLTVVAELTVMTSLVIISLANIGCLLLDFSCYQRRKVGDSAAITPFVIVPCQHLGHLPFYHYCGQRIN